MYSNNFMNKPSFMTNSTTSGFGSSTTSTFGQPAANTSMFSTMQPPNIFQTPSTSSFNAGPSTQTTFGSNLFGQQQPSTSGLFGSNATTAFGQNKPTFGFGSTQPQTGLFGQQAQTQAATPSFQSNTSNLFGGSSFVSQQPTTTGTTIKFAPVTGSDTMQKNGISTAINTKHHCITCMKEYANKSFEELRSEDYSANRKGPQQQPGFTPFGQTSGLAPSLFGQMDNKSQFGQPTSFGQTSTFGQITPSFGANTQTSKPSLFGKPAFGTVNPQSFEFNTTSTASNPFTASQPAKPFSQPLFGTATTQAQNTFGAGIFGQTPNQNATSNLFQKPAQPTGFNTTQSGFSFNQTPTTQTSSLFPAAKPATGFGLFGQTSTAPAFGQTSQPAFGTSFGKPTTTPFAQPTQPAFGSTLTGQSQPSLFGNTPAKSLFGNTGTGGLFGNNMFQQAQNSFSLNLNPQQPTQFLPDVTDDSKNLSYLMTDLFPDGPHIYGLEPVLLDSKNSTTNPQDLKAVLNDSRKREETLGTRSKLKVAAPKPRRGTNFKQEFFESNQMLKNSPKFLVIRNSTATDRPIADKYSSNLLEEAEKSLKQEGGGDTLTPKDLNNKEIPQNQNLALRLKFDSTLEDTTTSAERANTPLQSFPVDESDFSQVSPSKMTLLTESKISTPKSASLEKPIKQTAVTVEEEHEVEECNNPAGVILTKPEYYMYPPLKDLAQYMDDNGECIVQGLTIGRRGYGNVYFADPINIANMNFDELVHFRHRGVIIYPDDAAATKPPVGEGLNRRAQVTLDKIFPREKGTTKFITDVDEILSSNFIDNLMHVTQKHNSKFIEYRPKTGSWVFQVKHFSKYFFTDSDDEKCAVSKSSQEIKLKKTSSEEVEEISPSWGLGGLPQKQSIEPSDSPVSLLFDPNMSWNARASFLLENQDSSIQMLKSSLFSKTEPLMRESPMQEEMQVVKQRPCEVISTPKVYKLPNMSFSAHQENITFTQRCYSDLGIFRNNTFRVGWAAGFQFCTLDVVAETDLIYALNICNTKPERVRDYNTMMPKLHKILKVVLKESTFSNEDTPTCYIENGVTYLEKLTELFERHASVHGLSGRGIYLFSVWKLCMALWGQGDSTVCGRRRSLSDWLKQFTYELESGWSPNEFIEVTEKEAFETIFKLLTFYKIADACKFAMKNNYPQLSLLIGQLNANERYKKWLQKEIDALGAKEQNVVIDEYKKIYLLLSGILSYGGINTCEDLEWLRAFALHLWYLTPSACPIDVAFRSFQQSIEDDIALANKPKPHYLIKGESQHSDLLYQILALYVNGTHQLCNVLDPETHTSDVMDYRLSWLLGQFFVTLKIGLVRDTEKEYLHTTFSSQLENLGEWKWAIFVLLFLKNNTLKKNLIVKILERNIDLSNDTLEIENELVEVFKIPCSWIHEVKAIKAKVAGRSFEYFHHSIHMADWNNAHKTLVDDILPELFINEQYSDMSYYINKIMPQAQNLLNWNSQTGLFAEFLQLRNLKVDIEKNVEAIGQRLCFLVRRIGSFPTKNDRQKLCVAELYRKCIGMAQGIYEKIQDRTKRDTFTDALRNLVLPHDIKYYEISDLIAQMEKF